MLCFLQRDEVRCNDIFLLLLQHDAQHCINAICPLRFRIGKDKPVVRRFYAAGYKRFLGEGYFVRALCIVYCDFLRFGKGNEFLRNDYISVFRVNLIVILIGSGVEFQDIAGFALIAAQLDFGEYDFLRFVVKSGVFKCDFLRFLRRNEFYGADILLAFIEHYAEHSVNAVGPPGSVVGEHKAVVGRFYAACGEGFLDKGHSVLAARIVHGDFFCFGKGDEFLRTDYISASRVNLIVILIGSGVKFKDIAGLVQKLNEFLPREHDFLRRFVKLRVLQRNFPRFL